MRHLVVRRIALALVAVLCAAALAFAWRHAGATLPGADGLPAVERAPAAELFERHCAGCHDAGALAATLAGAPDPTAAVLDLLALLADHGATDADGDRALAALLWQRARTGR